MPGHPLCKVPQESLAYTHLCSNHAAKEPMAGNTLGHPPYTHCAQPHLQPSRPGNLCMGHPRPANLVTVSISGTLPVYLCSENLKLPQPLPISASVILPECLCIKNPRTPSASSHFSFSCPDRAHSLQRVLGPPWPMPNSAVDIPPGQSQQSAPGPRAHTSQSPSQ